MEYGVWSIGGMSLLTFDELSVDWLFQFRVGSTIYALADQRETTNNQDAPNQRGRKKLKCIVWRRKIRKD